MSKGTVKNRFTFPRALLLPAGLAVLLSLHVPSTPAWAEMVGVRLGAHADYTRVVIDFNRLVGYSVDNQSGTVTMTFDADAALSAASKNAGLVQNLQTASDGKTGTLTLRIPENARIKHYRLMRKIVLDVYPPARGGDKNTAPAAEQKTDKPAERTAAATPLPTPKPEATAPSVAVPPPAAAENTAATAPLPPSAETTAPPLTEGPALTALVPPGVQELPADTPSLPDGVLVDQAPPPPPAPPAADVADKQTEPTQIRFSSVAPLQIAVFTRDDKLWIVTEGSTGSAEAPQAAGPLANLMGAPEIMRFAGGTAYRYRLPPETFVGVGKSNMTWEVTLGPLPLQALGREVVHVETDKASGEAKLLAALKGRGKLLSLEDPDAGDILQIIPVSDPAARIDQRRRFSDVEIMPAYTGMVIRPLADGLRVTRINDYVLISASNGIHATPDAGPVLLNDSGNFSGDHPRLFDFPNWRQGGIQYLSRNRRLLEQRAATAPNDDVRNEALMNMALLYFANNFGQETLGILRLIEARNPALARNVNFIALRGAASAMAGHYQDALQDLSNPAIQQHPEVSLWVGYAAAATEQWRMANRSFPADNTLLLEYPPNIATPFTIYMAESALRLGRTNTATKLLDTLYPWSADMDTHHRAAIAYLKGEVARQEGRKTEALRIWRPVANGRDQLYHAKASIALANLELAEGKITLKDAIDRLDSLRFAWRGDGLEVHILHTLGLLRTQNGQYLDGLNDMRTAMTLADSLQDDTSIIRADMSRVIADIFVGGQAENIAPLEAISIHSAYGSLLPTGIAGSVATLNFADFLIRVDLLDKAAELIDAQLTAGTAPPEKVPALGAKMAAIYLLDSRAADALSAVQRSQRSGTDPKLERERQMLRARALSQLGRTDEAIGALAADDTPDGRRLKADILWRAQRWVPAAQIIESLLPSPPPPTLEAETAEMVVNAAVAYKLGGDNQGLSSLRERFLTSISATPQANTFGIITRPGGRSTLADRDTILKIAGEVDMFKGFLKSYQSAAGGGG